MSSDDCSTSDGPGLSSTAPASLLLSLPSPYLDSRVPRTPFRSRDTSLVPPHFLGSRSATNIAVIGGFESSGDSVSHESLSLTATTDGATALKCSVGGALSLSLSDDTAQTARQPQLVVSKPAPAHSVDASSLVDALAPEKARVSKREKLMKRLKRSKKQTATSAETLPRVDPDCSAPLSSSTSQRKMADSLPELSSSPSSPSSSPSSSSSSMGSPRGCRPCTSQILREFMTAHEILLRDEPFADEPSTVTAAVEAGGGASFPGIYQRVEHKRGPRLRQMIADLVSDQKERNEADYLSQFAGELTRDAFPFLQLTPPAVYDQLPPVAVPPLDYLSCSEFATLPGVHEDDVGARLYGVRESNYPTDPMGVKQGDPICDAFGYLLFKEAALVVLADGCGWGQSSANAALLATQTFLQTFAAARHAHLTNVRSIGMQLLHCLTKAHLSLAAAPQLGTAVGTTTLIAGLVLPAAAAALPSADAYVKELLFDDVQRSLLVAVSLGDCKVFVYSPSTRQVRDVTRGNRRNVSDPCDPGGRIGRTSTDNTDPDLRNLCLYCHPCVAGDIVLFMSDGVHDNFDPECLGVEPHTLGLATDWASAPPAQCEQAKTAFMEDLVGRLLTNARSFTPKLACRTLLDHASRVSQAARSYLESGQNGRLPKDYRQYPGKMDHSTIVATQVGQSPTDGLLLSKNSLNMVLKTLEGIL